MTLNAGEKSSKALPIEELDSKYTKSKTSLKDKKTTEESSLKKPKSTLESKLLRYRSKTCDGFDSQEIKRPSSRRPSSANTLTRFRSKSNQSETQINTSENGDKNQPKLTLKYQKSSNNLTPKQEGSKISIETGIKKPLRGGESFIKKPSEIPKFRSTPQANLPKVTPRTRSSVSRVPTLRVRETQEPIKDPKAELAEEIKAQKKAKWNEKIEAASKDNFLKLVPACEKELKKITEVWTNITYCSLTMRRRLLKLLFEAFPYIEKAQFNTENEQLFCSIDRAQNCSAIESKNLIQFVQALISNQEKFRDDYAFMAANKEVAESFNYEWKELLQKLTDIEEETKQILMETPELQRKKKEIEMCGNNKIRSLESIINIRDEEIKKLKYQFSILKQRENTYKGNVCVKVEDYKDIKSDVDTLISVKKEYEKMKANFMGQNDMFEKKVKDLENILEEKEKILEKEMKVKKRLQEYTGQVQDQKNRLCKIMGKEQLSFVMGGPVQDRERKRELLWMTAIKLVLKGFFIQMKKLERDRNKMLLELQVNDSENLKSLAKIIFKKDSFIKSLQQQIKDYQNLDKNPHTKTAAVAKIEH